MSEINDNLTGIKNIKQVKTKRGTSKEENFACCFSFEPVQTTWKVPKISFICQLLSHVESEFQNSLF